MNYWKLASEPGSAYWRAFPPMKATEPAVGGIAVIGPFPERRRPRRPITVGITTSYR